MSKGKSPDSKGRQIGNENVNQRDGRVRGSIGSKVTPANKRIRGGSEIIQGHATPPMPDGDGWKK